ncbi:MAG: hypothetical protein QOJ15_6818 [Bradyrhizobium sp.]|jgi:hypothetical protein|nr:hypothetical protein [Bradyrhizobium sp.]
MRHCVAQMDPPFAAFVRLFGSSEHHNWHRLTF